MDTNRPPDDWGDQYTPTPRKADAGSHNNRPQLDAASEALRTAWITSIRDIHVRRTGCESRYNSHVKWDGGRQPAANKAGFKVIKPVWPTIVAVATKAGITDPIDLVRVLFSKHSSDTAPTPYALTTPQVIEAARKFKLGRRNRIALARRAEEGVFRMAIWSAGLSISDPTAAASYVLNDTGRDMSPLFRYSVAVLRGLTDVAGRWRDAAVNQLLQDPAPYLDYWASLIPIELQQAAAPAVRTCT